MGEIVTMLHDGLLCSICGMVIDGDIPGYQRTCDSCSKPTDESEER